MKQSKWIIFIYSLLLAGCAAYKELEPVPQISFIEHGYIELLDDQEKFELSEGNKYFIRFPQPVHENTYLVLNFKDKNPVTSYLTRIFDDGEGTIIKLTDESEDPSLFSVYPIDKTIPVYYWVIEEVRADVILDMTYRYVAQWRYKFEKKHAQFEQILEENIQSRKILDDIGTTLSPGEIDYPSEKQSVTQKTKNIEQVYQQLYEIEAILPPDILNTKDPAYKDYLALKDEIDKELTFQREYLQIMDLLEVVSSPQPDIEKFVSQAPVYSKLFANKTKYPANFYQALNQELERTLPMAIPYYEKQLDKKNDILPIEIDLKSVRDIYSASGITPEDNLKELESFISNYNQRASALTDIKDQLNSINKNLAQEVTWPSDMFYTDKRAQLSRMNYNIPSSDLQVFGRYSSYTCVFQLSQSIRNVQNEIRSLNKNLQRAELLIPQINQLRTQRNYPEILRLLKQNSDLTFLSAQYAELDELSLTQQRQSISSALSINDFQRAENSLRKFDQDRNFLNPGIIIPRKDKLVRAYDDSLYQKVEKVSLQNANNFIAANTLTVDMVDSLYNDSALFPAYMFNYSITPGSTDRKNQTLTNKMNSLRSQKFPETSIEALYRSFTDAMHVQGVEKARAIVAHGRYYTGNKRKFKNLIAECDPGASKWVTKPKLYRKIYALPVSTNIGGSNQYMAKINLQIPTEAKFPVYDVNIKLPQEVARHADSRQWYDTITFNKKILKNEGRFTITAPDPNNDYIAQITPLQVNKTGNNVLEIRFNYNAFKVLEISVMAQKPIIKKH